MKHHNLLNEVDQERLYLIHHMHHYGEDNKIFHELHHCFLFSKKGMKGNKYSVDHLWRDDKLFHIIVENNPPGILYDHIDNSFNIEKLNLDHKKFSVVGKIIR